MKIVIVQGAFLPVPPLLGGAVEKIWFRLGREFVARGHEVVHLSRRYARLPDREELDGVRHVRVDGFETPRSLLKLKFLDLVYSLRVATQIPRDADVIVTNTFWLPVLLRGARGRRVYVDVQRMPKRQMALYRHVGRLRANSSPVERAIRAELTSGRSPAVKMIPNPLPFDLPANLPPGPRAGTILYVGRVHPEKGLDLLMKAAAHLEWKGWEIRVVGPWSVAEGGGGEDYLSSLKGLAGSAPVEFVGPVYDPAALGRHYADAAIFCYPSVAEQGETFGLAPLEAMAWGVPPVVSDLACFRDFIESGESGLVFDHRSPRATEALAEALRGLMANPGRREQISGHAREVAARYSSDRMAEAFLEDFADVAAAANA